MYLTRTLEIWFKKAPRQLLRNCTVIWGGLFPSIASGVMLPFPMIAFMLFV
jgi:hypothetical protein